MLVLARRLHERIKIGDGVWVEVVDIDGGKVRLGIAAPPSIDIYREELLPAAEQFHGGKRGAKEGKEGA